MTAQELAFDYLWTNLAGFGDELILEQVMYPHHSTAAGSGRGKGRSGLPYAIVDEADFVFIGKSIGPPCASPKLCPPGPCRAPG